MKTSPESTVGVGKIEDVYKHWRANHVIPMASKPFQFYVAEIAGEYSHSKFPNEVFADTFSIKYYIESN